MHMQNVLAGFAMNAALATIACSSAIATAEVPPEAPIQAGARLPVAQIYARLEADGYRRISNIEREGHLYEVKATDRDGKRVKLYINTQTGKIDEQWPSVRAAVPTN